MRFAIMRWESAEARDIYGIVDADDPAMLPSPSIHGYWADYKLIDERQFVLPEDAKKAIAAAGYFLLGAGLTLREAFGSE